MARESVYAKVGKNNIFLAGRERERERERERARLRKSPVMTVIELQVIHFSGKIEFLSSRCIFNWTNLVDI